MCLPTNPYDALVRPPVCLWCTSKLSNFAKFHVYSLRILHLSSNRREWNSAPPFQFVSPGRELIQKSIKSMNFQHFHTQKSWISEAAQLFATWDQSIFKSQPRKTQISSKCTHWPLSIVTNKENTIPNFALFTLCTHFQDHFVALVLSRPYLKFNQMHSMTPFT